MSFLGSNEKSSILITGGATGIGFALAKQLVKLGHEVIVCAKDQAKLKQVQKEVPQLVTFVGDVSSDEGRVAMAEKVAAEYPQLNVIINNAGILADVPPLIEMDPKMFSMLLEEQQVDYIAPVHLSILLSDVLMQKKHAMIANITSLTAFVPDARHANYSSANAGTHSITMSMRLQLRGTPISVVEIIPPLVETDMLPEDVKGHGLDVDEFAKSAVTQMIAGAQEVYYGTKDIVRFGSKTELDKKFSEVNNKRKTKRSGGVGHGGVMVE